MNNDSISRQAAIEALDELIVTISKKFQKPFRQYRRVLKDILPPVQPERKGKWVWDEDVLDWEKEYVCSECGCYALKEDGHQVRSNFCPNCGLRMEEGNSDE